MAKAKAEGETWNVNAMENLRISAIAHAFSVRTAISAKSAVIAATKRTAELPDPPEVK